MTNSDRPFGSQAPEIRSPCVLNRSFALTARIQPSALQGAENVEKWLSCPLYRALK
jgi:hypothetical protein